MQLNTTRLTARVQRARAAIGHGITYQMGAGGLHADDPLPTRTKVCDCTGFASWVLYLDRDLGATDKAKRFGYAWIETTLIHKDILGPQKLFVEIEGPVAGCVVCWGDTANESGHIGLVSVVHPDGGYDVIDCSSVSSRKYGEAIREHKDTYFHAHPGVVYGALREDLD